MISRSVPNFCAKSEIAKFDINRRSNMKDIDLNQDRRGFFKWAGTAVAAVAASSIFPFARARAQELKALDEKDPVAMALGYACEASKVDTKKWTKRAGKDGKTQFCDNCMFYSAPKGNMGKCQIFPNNMVCAKGWCNSWSKKV